MWYLLYNPVLMELYELVVGDVFIAFVFRDYRIIYLYNTDRLIIQLPLGFFLGSAENPEFLDIEAVPSTMLLDALENLLKESIVLAESS